MKTPHCSGLLLAFLLSIALAAASQTITGTLEGRVLDASGAALSGARVVAVNSETGFTRAVEASALGAYLLLQLPPGEYTVTAESSGFRAESKRIRVEVGQTAVVDFNLAVGGVVEQVDVVAATELVSPTRSSVASVIAEREITTLPISGRQFIDFALLAPGVTVGETTSGSTDVIIEPVPKLSFAGQNIHFNLVTVDGADNISTASGIQKTTPSQEAVREFQVINTTYSAELGRAVGGIINIVTHGGTNEFHGSLYEYFRNDAMDARSILASPGLDKLRQNQFGATLGGPLRRDRTFFALNYEGQRRRESPFYNSAVLENIDAINAAKVNLYGLPAEDLNVTRSSDYDTVTARADHALSDRNHIFARYFFYDARLLNLSPLNDGFDMPSTFRDNLFRDNSMVVNLNSTLSPTFLNELRGQYAHRSFDFPVTTTQPHMEVANTFTFGVNRGNPDFYEESRFEILDNVSLTRGRHTISFGGNYNWVRTTESFPLFFPFEATFASVDDLLNGIPFVIFFQKFDFDATGIDPAVYQGSRFSDAVRNQASGTLDHTYTGFYIQNKWRATQNFTMNFGVRYEFETWPEGVVNTDWNNIDPRFGFAYNLGTSNKVVIRGGAGFFHGIIPAPLLMCQRPSCGGSGPFPGRESIQNELNATTRLFAFASIPPVMQSALSDLINNGTYPTVSTPFDFLGEAVIVRFTREHQAPYGIQSSLGVEFELAPNTALSASYLRVKGVHLGSFYNVNQPDPTGVLENGKDDFAFLRFDRFNSVPGVRDPNFAVYFEADSRWSSVFDGLLVNLARRAGKWGGFGVSYTWSKTIDDGPNPSFVLIPENSQRFDLERAISSDHIGHRFVFNGTLNGPTDLHPLLNHFQLGTIVSLQSARFFTRFAGFDANGDVFGVNDRVDARRNTFKGDGLQSVDLRISRAFQLSEGVRLSAVAEAFNLLNTLNVRFFNTVYGDSIVNPPGTPGTFQDGARNPAFGSPRAIFNPRQIQLAVKFTF